MRNESLDLPTKRNSRAIALSGSNVLLQYIFLTCGVLCGGAEEVGRR